MALACVIALAACGGGSGRSDGVVSDDIALTDNTSPFPPARPSVDPPSSVAEIESHAQSLFSAYDELMVEVFRQINDLYRTIESGVDSSDDPDTLERDARLYDRIASEFCGTTRDADGGIVSLSGCSATPLAFRHPVYGDVLIHIDRYELATGYIGFSDVEIWNDGADSRLPRILVLCTDDGFCSGTSQASENDATYLDVSMDVPGGFIGEENECLLQFDPFVFGEGVSSTNVNECAALLQDALIVVERLVAR